MGIKGNLMNPAIITALSVTLKMNDTVEIQSPNRLKHKAGSAELDQVSKQYGQNLSSSNSLRSLKWSWYPWSTCAQETEVHLNALDDQAIDAAKDALMKGSSPSKRLQKTADNQQPRDYVAKKAVHKQANLSGLISDEFL